MQTPEIGKIYWCTVDDRVIQARLVRVEAGGLVSIASADDSGCLSLTHKSNICETRKEALEILCSKLEGWVEHSKVHMDQAIQAYNETCKRLNRARKELADEHKMETRR